MMVLLIRFILFLFIFLFTACSYRQNDTVQSFAINKSSVLSKKNDTVQSFAINKSSVLSKKNDTVQHIRVQKQCNFLPARPMPLWVTDPSDNISSNYYYGIGTADYVDNKPSYQIKYALISAKRDLSHQILSSISSDESLKKSFKDVKEALHNFEKKTINYTSSINIKSHTLIKKIKTNQIWLDKKSCVVWALVTVSKKDVAKFNNKVNHQLNNLLLTNQYFIQAKLNTKNYTKRLHYVNLAIKQFEILDKNFLQQIGITNIDILQKYYKNLLITREFLLKQKHNILNKIYIGMSEDKLLKIIHPKQGDWVLPIPENRQIESIKYKDKYFILENYRVACVVGENEYVYKTDDLGRIINYSCQWYFKNRKKSILMPRQ